MCRMQFESAPFSFQSGMCTARQLISKAGSTAAWPSKFSKPTSWLAVATPLGLFYVGWLYAVVAL